MTEPRIIWTIGHSNRTIEIFIDILQSHSIQLVVDVRQYPGSRKYPYFNKEPFQLSLHENSIGYVHLIELGGRRKPAKDSPNITWKNDAFRAYADYMETDAFAKAVNKLEQIAAKQNTAYMCSEAVWWSCHRSMISDYLKANGWKVMHIMDINKATEHPYTSPAKIVDGKLTYRPNSDRLLFPDP
jgi:uncharacterized protein (DUF488 family)